MNKRRVKIKKGVLSLEEKRIKHNLSQKRHYYNEKAGNVRIKMTPDQRRENHNASQRKHSYVKWYGITVKKYNALLEIQGHCCAICGANQSILKRPLGVDHDHKTGIARGLLCDNCNTFRGHAKEDIGILNKAVVYLKKYLGNELFLET